MSPLPLRAPVLLAGLLALCAVPFALSQPRPRDAAPAQADAKAEDVKKLRNVGATNCSRCHREPLPDDKEQKVTDFLHLDESTIWRQHDLHAKAFQVLTGPLGKQMGELLGWDVTKRVECLACHAVNLSQELTPGVPRPGASPEVFHTADGVGCEACHGVADKWFRDHIDKSWRSVPPEEKLTKYGERDMRNPEARAERCAACHVGNMAEGKFVTHAMYAAGHPPLPPLETMTFSRDQPMHAKLPRDLPYFQTLDADAAWKLFHYRKGESEPARVAAVGAAVGFREAMKSLAHAADAAQAEGRMLDFALFDCAACHHDLIAPSWRQERGFAGTPGRPLPRTGPTTLLRTLAGQAGDAAGGFDSRFAALVKACDARPFGDPAAIGPAARDLAAWSDALAKSLNQAHYDDAQTAKLLRAVAEAARRKPEQPGQGLDYDDAQQLLWAFDVLRGECKGLSPEIGAELAKLAGPGKPMLGPLYDGANPRPLIAGVLPDRLRRVAGYRPETFRQTFDRIAGVLGPAAKR
jgi:hypothetical protein